MKGHFSRGNDDDLAEALRLLGQGLHTLEDFGAHTNYVELALIELGHRDVFPLTGRNTQINVQGKRVWPLVTGTFGMVDFYHSVLGEATDHFTQSEVNEMDNAMGVAQQASQSSNPLSTLVKLLSKVPGTGGLADEAQRLASTSQAEARRSQGTRGMDDYSGSRGVDDYSSSRGPGDFPGASSYGAASHDSYNSYGQQNQGGHNAYNQQQGYNNYNQPPPQQWNQPPPQQQWQQPAHDQYNQAQSWNQHGQSSQSQWQQPAQQHDNYNQGSSYQQSASSQNQGQYSQTSHQNIPPAVSTPSQPQQGPVSAPQGLPGYPDFDPAKTIKQIYPILAFRDKVVRSISAIIEKIPGLEALVERIVETLTVFIFSLLAPFVRPVLNALQKTLASSSEGVTESNKKHQYEVWDDPNCSDPTHSLLSKDHFSNILNEPAGAVAGEILKFIAPRVLYAWEHPEVPVERVMQDVDSIFHHPALRNEHGNECHRSMFNVVRTWAQGRRDIDSLLNMQAVRDGKNHKEGVNDHAGHGGSMGAHPGAQNHGQHGNTPQGGYGAYLQQAESVVSGLTGIGGHQGGGHGGSYQNNQSNQGGIGGLLGQASSFLGQSGGHGSSQHGGGGAGGFLGQASSFLGGNSGHGGSSHGGHQGGGLNDMLGMASKLPGVGQYASQMNNFNKLSSAFGGGRRGLDDEQTREIQRERGFVDDGDYGDSEQYKTLGLSQVGGANELYESAFRAGNIAPTPSPGPMPAPSGYEEYSRGGDYIGQGYEAQQGYVGGHASNQNRGYPSQQYGGESSSYYR